LESCWALAVAVNRSGSLMQVQSEWNLHSGVVLVYLYSCWYSGILLIFHIFLLEILMEANFFVNILFQEPIRKGAVSHTLMVEELGRRRVNHGVVLRVRPLFSP